jgi:NAD(P)H-hydrate epimerase
MMRLPIVSSAEMRRIEEAAFAAGATAEKLMEKVGRLVAEAVGQTISAAGVAQVFYGKGNNGGDALVAARYLAAAGWVIELHPQESDTSKISDLSRKKLAELASVKLSTKPRGDLTPRPLVILDGLLGIGATGPLREDIRALTRGINQRRIENNAQVFAVDLPTGLNADTGRRTGIAWWRM